MQSITCFLFALANLICDPHIGQRLLLCRLSENVTKTGLITNEKRWVVARDADNLRHN
jgi:hypothetical protein